MHCCKFMLNLVERFIWLDNEVGMCKHDCQPITGGRDKGQGYKQHREVKCPPYPMSMKCLVVVVSSVSFLTFDVCFNLIGGSPIDRAPVHAHNKYMIHH